MHYKIITMLIIRTDRNKIIKPRLKKNMHSFLWNHMYKG